MNIQEEGRLVLGTRVDATSYTAGTPVAASNQGAMAALVEHGRTDLLFEAGNPADLVPQVQYLMEHPDELARMRLAARAEFEAKYTADRNYEMLLAIYHRVLGR